MLSITGETIPGQVIIPQPPPYIGPPRPHDLRKTQSYEDFGNDSKSQAMFYPRQCDMYDNRSNYYQQQQPSQMVYHQQTYIDDPRNYQIYEKNPQYLDHQSHVFSNYNENQNQRMYIQQVVDAQNSRNQQFFTLPNRKSQKEIEPPRSVTPDITRGLSRGPVSSMHMLARQSQKPTPEQIGYHRQPESDTYMDLRRRHMELEARSKLFQQQQQHRNPPVDVRNR